MKRLFATVLALVMVMCVLAACGQSAKAVDLPALLDKINAQYGMSDLKVLGDASDLNRYYAIEEADVKQFAAEMNTAASAYNEVIIVEAVSADAAKTISDQLGSHLDSQLSTAKSYDKDAVAMVESCKVEQNGNFVYLVIGENAEGINKMIADEISG